MEQDDRQILRDLFAEYDVAEQELALAKEKVEVAMEERSKVLQKIMDAGGPGPYNRNGALLKIVKRGSTLFFRGKGQSDAIEI